MVSTTGELDHHQGETEPNPNTISTRVDANPQVGHTVFEGDDGETYSLFDVRYDPKVTSTIAANRMQRELDKWINGRFTDGAKVVNVQATIRPVGPNEQANFAILNCPGQCLNSKGQGREGYYPRNTTNVFMRAGYKSSSGAHEFMHYLGMWHQSNATNALTSYSNHRKMTFDEAYRLSSAYR